MRSKWITIGLIIITLLSLNAVNTVAQDGPDLGKLTSSLFTNPTSLFIFIFQLALGIGLGYVAVKALKYLLVLAAFLILGIVLNIWQAPQLDIDFRAVSSQIIRFAFALGLTTVLPLTIGFVVGALIGTLK